MLTIRSESIETLHNKVDSEVDSARDKPIRSRKPATSEGISARVPLVGPEGSLLWAIPCWVIPQLCGVRIKILLSLSWESYGRLLYGIKTAPDSFGQRIVGSWSRGRWITSCDNSHLYYHDPWVPGKL